MDFTLRGMGAGGGFCGTDLAFNRTRWLLLFESQLEAGRAGQQGEPLGEG